MAERVIVTLHLPLPMGAVGAILRVVGREFPDAVIGEDFTVVADPELTPDQARAKVKARSGPDLDGVRGAL